MNHPRCKHGNVVCSKCVIVTDAAKRMADQINGRIAFSNSWEIRNCYMAFRLDDGSTNGTLYDSKPDAIRHTDEKQHAYFCIRQGLAGVSPLDCQIFLNVHRWAYNNGVPFADPDLRHSPDIILSTRAYDMLTGRIRSIQ
jgi:hypothetical protein